MAARRRNNLMPLLILGIGAVAAFAFGRRATAAPNGRTAAEMPTATLPPAYQTTATTTDLMATLDRAFGESEWYWGLPSGILKAMARVESGFDPDVIFCRKLGGIGEKGIMQIAPQWHPNVDACNPDDAIWYAGGYLKENFDRFGSWRLAVAAYNWGPTNLANKGYDAAPAITKSYVSRVAQEVSI